MGKLPLKLADSHDTVPQRKRARETEVRQKEAKRKEENIPSVTRGVMSWGHLTNKPFGSGFLQLRITLTNLNQVRI